MDDMSLANYAPSKYLDSAQVAKVEHETGKQFGGNDAKLSPWGNRGGEDEEEEIEEIAEDF